MPQLLIGVITPYIASGLFAITGSTAFVVAATGVVASALVYAGLAAAAYLVSSAFQPAKPEAPKPEDGKYALKQSVPPLVYILGRVKKSGDYVFLEEKAGAAYHIVVDAAHRINGYAQHYLHDEPIALNEDGTIAFPSHFEGKVTIHTRSGLDGSTAYSNIVAAFPEIWTPDHRGDGLASVMMAVSSVEADKITAVFPQGMPQRSSIIEGHNQLIDPRTGIKGYSTNIAIFRYWHLAHPVGAKLSIDDLYTPDWAHAADVCDQDVLDRDNASLKRYHGGFWFRANNDPVQIGRMMDQAAELVIYERADGKIGVHAGEFVEPDVRLTANDLISVSYDANRRLASNVLAARGHYTDPDKGFNTTDAAPYGDAYADDTERTKTVDNAAVQKHNHMARLEKLAFVRANAPRVKLVAHYEPARQVPYRRFVRVHFPPKMNEAIVEITGRPTLSLRNLTYSFEGIIVPSDLYAFNAGSEEGEPPASIDQVERSSVPEPLNFSVAIETETVAEGTAAFAVATFGYQGETFQYEVEWQPVSGGAPPQTVMGQAASLTLRTGYLADGAEYRFRARTWSAGTPSEWTAYQRLKATGDNAAPALVTGVSGVGGDNQATISWTAPASANYYGARIYWSTVNSTTGAVLAATEYGPPSAADSRVLLNLPAGTVYVFVSAINAAGVASAPAATGPITVV